MHTWESVVQWETEKQKNRSRKARTFRRICSGVNRAAEDTNSSNKRKRKNTQWTPSHDIPDRSTITQIYKLAEKNFSVDLLINTKVKLPREKRGTDVLGESKATSKSRCMASVIKFSLSYAFIEHDIKA